MDKNFLPLLFSDFSQKTSNFPDFSWSSNKFRLPWSGNSALVGGNSKLKNEDPSEGNTKNRGGGTKKCGDHICDHLGICIEYTYISEFILWLHQGEFVKVKWV